jgi:hypothetical protein
MEHLTALLIVLGTLPNENLGTAANSTSVLSTMADQHDAGIVMTVLVGQTT